MNKTTKLKLACVRLAQLRVERRKTEYGVALVSRFLKKSNRREIKFRDYTVFIDDSSRTTIPRQSVLDELGADWVRVHEKTSRFKMIRIVRNKK
jgi:hypothetical protein